MEPEKLAAVLEAVRWSPSWANTQCWEVVVIQDKKIQTALQSVISPRNPATKAMVAAPVVLALCGKQHSSGWYDGKQSTRYEDWMLYDLGIATQSIGLVAHSLGLATVVVGLFDHAAVDTILGVPAGYQAVSLLPLGYPDASPSPPHPARPLPILFIIIDFDALISASEAILSCRPDAEIPSH